ncbi:MAG: hypothetical protein IPO82_04505 [Betaproteobacteria bacterium]|nr:hypothetical protein [Betaproteobacteria bacterium]
MDLGAPPRQCRHATALQRRRSDRPAGTQFLGGGNSVAAGLPQHLRTFDIRRNGDDTISIIVTNVDPAVSPGSPAARSRDYAVGAYRIFNATAQSIGDNGSHAYNAELVLQLTTKMRRIIAGIGSPL